MADVMAPRWNPGGRGSSPTGWRRGLMLTAVCLSLVLVMAGVAMLNLALPAISVDLGASQAEQQWILDSYTVALAGLLLPFGALGDRYGRRLLLLAGVAIFGVAAAASVVADTTWLLVVLRATSGAGAAMILPATLATITSVYPAQERAKAVGVWAGFMGIGGILGLLVAGFLLEHFWWGSLFVFTGAAAGMALLLSWLMVPDTKDPSHAHLDPAGAVLSLIGIGALVLSIIEGPSRGWTDVVTLGAFIGGALAIAAWGRWSLRTDKPLLDFHLFAIPSFLAGSVSLFVQFMVLFGLILVVIQYLLMILGYGTLMAALSLAPAGVAIMPVALVAGHVAQRFGQRSLGVVGLFTAAVGFILLARMSIGSSYWHLFAGLVVAGLGIGLAMTPATNAIVDSLPPAKQGVASAVNDVARELGAAFGIAVLGSAFNAGYRNAIAPALVGLPPDAGDAARDSPVVALGVAEQLGERGVTLVGATREAFMTGTRQAMAMGAVVLVGGAVLVAWRAPRPADDPAVREPGASAREGDGSRWRTPRFRGSCCGGREGGSR